MSEGNTHINVRIHGATMVECVIVVLLCVLRIRVCMRDCTKFPHSFLFDLVVVCCLLLVCSCWFFARQADAPDPSRIPAADLLGVTVVLLIGSYKDKEFIRVGYYVNNSYGM